MFIIKYKKIFLSISMVLVIFAAGSISFFKLSPGIEFTGGALLDITYTESLPTIERLNFLVAPLALSDVLIQPKGDNGYIIKTRTLTPDEKEDLMIALSSESPLQENSFTSIGPSVGRELVKKSIIAIILVSLGIVFYLAYAFRGVSKPVSSWKYGMIAVVTLMHDIIIPAGIFAAISHFTGAQIDTLFVVALLTILGLSVSDTIVIFDRIRENIKSNNSMSFPDLVGKSLSESFARSINTSLTTILMLIALYFFGPESTKNFALVLGMGLIVGTYSSIFLASPLLVFIEKIQKKKEHE